MCDIAADGGSGSSGEQKLQSPEPFSGCDRATRFAVLDWLRTSVAASAHPDIGALLHAASSRRACCVSMTSTICYLRGTCDWSLDWLRTPVVASTDLAAMHSDKVAHTVARFSMTYFPSRPPHPPTWPPCTRTLVQICAA